MFRTLITLSRNKEYPEAEEAEFFIPPLPVVPTNKQEIWLELIPYTEIQFVRKFDPDSPVRVFSKEEWDSMIIYYTSIGNVRWCYDVEGYYIHLILKAW